MTKIKDMDFMSDAAMNEARIREIPNRIRNSIEDGRTTHILSMDSDTALIFAADLELAAGVKAGNEAGTVLDYDEDEPAATIPVIVWAIWIVGCSALGIWVFG